MDSLADNPDPAGPGDEQPLLHSTFQDGSMHADFDGGLDFMETSDVDRNPGSEVLPGVEDIEEVAMTWSTGALSFAYAMIWFIYLVQGLLAGTSAMLTPYITSDFSRHALTPAVGILSSVIGGVVNLTLAKVLDVFGRPHGFLICVLLSVLGLIIMSTCGSIEAYAAAQVLLTVGNNGSLYSLTVFVSDTSSLRNRGLLQSLISSPNLITCWLAGPLSLAILDGPGWHYAFGIFAVLVPISASPLLYFLLRNYVKARGTRRSLRRRGSGGDTHQAVVYCFRQFDAIGLVLLSCGIALFLLPFNIYATSGWTSPVVIWSAGVGWALLIAFVIWERYFAPVTFIQYSILLDRTVLGACALSAVLFLSFSSWNSFFSSYLQVVNNLSVKNAGFVVQSYTACSVLCSMAAGALIHYTGRFKPLCLYLGVPLSMLGSILLTYLLRVGGSVGSIVTGHTIIAIAAGIIMVSDEVAILSAVSHQYVAACLAIIGVFGSTGGAIGLTISSAIWQGVFPRSLKTYLPAEELPSLDKIYANISIQISYPVGSEARIAIQHAYQDAQSLMLGVGTASWIIGCLAVLLWRDLNVIKIKHTKGQIW